MEQSVDKRKEVLERIQKELTTTFKTEYTKSFDFAQVQEAYDFYLHNMSKGKVLIKIGI